MLLLDLGVLSKKDHIVTFKEAAAWSAVWICCSLAFYTILDKHGEWVHGIYDFEKLRAVASKYATDLQLIPNNFEASLDKYRHHIALEYLTGYLLEYSLSVDNIFVIILIFASFNVEEKYYKKVLFWGILGAIVMRFIFIFLGSALIQEFSWILYLFGLFLLYSGAKMLHEALKNNEDEKIDTQNHPVVKLASRYFAIYPKFVAQKFFHREDGKFFITPLFLVLIIIEFTDLIFAVDSVPAVFAVTHDPFIVFFSNIFAILGLRSMFFFLTNILHLFHYLKYGLSVLLIFIGSKMLAHHWLKEIGFKTSYSLYIILAILAISVFASLVFPKKVQTI